MFNRIHVRIIQILKLIIETVILPFTCCPRVNPNSSHVYIPTLATINPAKTKKFFESQSKFANALINGNNIQIYQNPNQQKP